MIWQHDIVEGVDIDEDINEGVDIESDNDDNMDDAVEVSWRLNQMNGKKLTEMCFSFYAIPIFKDKAYCNMMLLKAKLVIIVCHSKM